MGTRHAALALTISMAVPAVAAPLPACGAGSQTAQIVVDARDGSFDGVLRYRKRDRARVCVTNMNPFVFEYDLEGQVHAVAEPALADINALLVPGAPASPKAAASPSPAKEGSVTRASVSDKTPTPPDPCAATLAALHGQTRALDTLVSTVKEQIASTNTSLAPLTSAWQTARLALFEGGAQTTPDLRKAAEAARDALDKPATEPVTEHQLDAIAERAVELRAELRELVDEATCASRDPRFVEDARRQIEETLGGFLPAAREARRAQHQTLARVQELRDALGRVLARPDAFETQRTFGPYSQPTDVTVSVRRKPLGGSAATDLAEVRLNFGGQARFAYSTGPFVSPLDNDTFGRVDGLLDGAPRAFVGYKERASTRTRLLALAHARLVDLGDDASLFVTLGRVLDTENELLLGVSLGVAENRFLITVGAYRGPRDVLESGFEPGQVLPTTFTAEVPVRKQFEWGVAAGLSVRVK